MVGLQQMWEKNPNTSSPLSLITPTPLPGRSHPFPIYLHTAARMAFYSIPIKCVRPFSGYYIAYRMKSKFPTMPYNGVWQTFSLKGRIVNILAFVSHMVSVPTT